MAIPCKRLETITRIGSSFNHLHLTIITVLFLSLTCLIALIRFGRRARREAQRQRVLTWPRTTATLPDKEDLFAYREVGSEGEPGAFRAELREPYIFYARGKRYTGNRLAPGLKRLCAREAELFLKKLRQGRQFAVYFDPDDPSRNYLTVGEQHLAYGHLLRYTYFGWVLPVGYGYVASIESINTGIYVMLYHMFAIASVIVLVMYKALRMPDDLGKQLLPLQDAEDIPRTSSHHAKDR